ncbi:hypothetical protein [Delftia sp. GW456-R20]|uniref:hypothetical protein n=1 Tax=Delftia sp. GW456-R20 TaxID=1827145 RepID=UPI0012E88CE2|nr:hypothetical protein [Delftia sp. GW456-R20]
MLSTYKSIKEDKFFAALISHNKAIIVEHTEPSKELQMPCYLLTAVGRQVLGLGSFEPDLDYLRVVGRNFVEQGFTVKIADWVGMPGGGGNTLMPNY